MGEANKMRSKRLRLIYLWSATLVAGLMFVGTQGAQAGSANVGPCPSPSAIISPRSAGDAVKPLFGKLPGGRHGLYIDSIMWASSAPSKTQAKSKCGSRVLNKSVFISLGPKSERTCSSCRTGFYMAKLDGGWRLWFID